MFTPSVWTFAALVVAASAMALLLSNCPPPGVFIAALGILAALVPLLWARLTAAEQTAWMAAFFVLLVLEIAAIYKASESQRQQFKETIDEIGGLSKKQDEQFDLTVKRLTEVGNTVAASFATLSQRIGQERAIQVATRIENPTAVQAKKNALDLSADMLRFVLERQATEPPLPRLETWEADMDALKRHSSESRSIANSRFIARLSQVREDLAKAGVTDSEFDQARLMIVNDLQVRLLAQKIADMAAQIKNPGQ